MQKKYLAIGLASLLLAACSGNEQQQYTAPPLPAYNGPVVEIPGIEPKYEAPIPTANQDYAVNGVNYKIVQDTTNFSQIGFAALYRREAAGNQTTSGEAFDPDAFTAAHPTLPIPSYVRVTNLANGRQVVVRINDRGPFIAGRIIDLSPEVADRLNTSNNAKVRIDIINVAADGSLSGPGTQGTRVAKLSYDLPSRPQFSAPTTTSAPQESSTANATAISPVVTAVNSQSGAPAAVTSAPQQPSSATSEPTVAQDPATSRTHSKAAAAATSGQWRVQVAAVNNSQRAQQLKKILAEKYNVSGHVEQVNSTTYRVQLGGYGSRAEASALQQRLAADKVSGFVTGGD